METMATARNDSSRFPFTSSQWQELEHQALVYKYMISGMPIPPDLLFSIQRSLDSSTKLFLHHHSPHQSIGLGWNCFQMGFGRKIDPEPGRCRRTDGKKWRCSKEAYPDSKYCERHMHRGRNRSRKPVEVTNSSSSPQQPPPLSISSKPLMNYPNSSSFLYPQLSSSRPPGSVQSSQDRFWLESSAYSSHPDKDNSYGMKEEGDEHEFGGDSWQLAMNMNMNMNMNTNTSSSSSSPSVLVQSKSHHHHHRSYSDYQNGYSYLQLQNTPKRQNDYDELGLKMERKDKVMHHFFDESPHKDDDDDDDKKDSSTTQLSISIPTGGAHDFFQTHNDK